MTDHRGYVVLVLRPGPDPLARQGLPGRPALYRLRLLLKGMLRRLGWSVVDYRDLYPTPWLWSPGEGI